MEGDDYYSLIDEFMAAIKLRWPTALVQFEDFQSKHAIKLLMRYKKEYLMFNDDIQGTAATVLAGLYGAMKVRGLAPADLKNQVFVVAGAGSAGSGVMLTIRNAIIRRHGLTKEEANKRFYIIDQDGLITKGRKNLAEMEDLFYDLSSFAVDDTSLEGLSLIDTINRVKPNVLIGLSAVGGLFNKEVLTAMNQNEAPPIIFPLSNPTSRSECTAKQAQEATGGRCIFASGTGFDDVEIDGKVIASSQCNNRYIFPGLALGAALGQTGVVTNAMINRAAEALVELIDQDDLARRATFPEKADIREISCHLAAKVFMQAVEEGLVGIAGCEQRNAGVAATRRREGAEDLYLQEDVVSGLQASGISTPWKRRIGLRRSIDQFLLNQQQQHILKPMSAQLNLRSISCF